MKRGVKLGLIVASVLLLVCGLAVYVAALVGAVVPVLVLQLHGPASVIGLLSALVWSRLPSSGKADAARWGALAAVTPEWLLWVPRAALANVLGCGVALAGQRDVSVLPLFASVWMLAGAVALVTARASLAYEKIRKN